jgi:hypothetical protein
MVKSPRSGHRYIATSPGDREKPLGKNHSPEPSQRAVVIYLLFSTVVFVRTRVKVQRSGELIFSIFLVPLAHRPSNKVIQRYCCAPPHINMLANTQFSMMSSFILYSASSFLLFIIFYIPIQFSSEFLQADQY